MSRVLNTGAYPPLLETRRLILEHAGHVVITRAEPELVKACRQYEFDVAVIGQSASPELKRRLFHLIRMHSAPLKVLELTTSDSGIVLVAADSWLEIYPMQADKLVQRIKELAKL